MTVPNFVDSSVLVLDHQAHIRQLMWSALKQIGFGHLRDVENIPELERALDHQTPDLVILDLDQNPAQVCSRIVDLRQRALGVNPFVVIAGTTWSPDEDAVRRALDSGIDDLVAKPLSVTLVHERIMNQVDHRKEFVITPEYFGPDRRIASRSATPAELEIPTRPVSDGLGRLHRAGTA
jgi:DNA-binding response OmpR family regulator